MKIIFLHLASALFYGAAGLFVFIMLLNRIFILMPDSRLKIPIILAAFTVLVVGAGVLGFFVHRPPWIFVPLAILLLILLGEVRRASIRRACAADGPIDSIPHKVALANPITTTDLIVHRYEVIHPRWNGKPFRIVQITDLHVRTNLSLEYFQEVISIAEESKPDLAVFTGDFITKLSALPNLKQTLRPIARVENLAILGNHDYWAGPEAVRAVVKESGLRLLSNETIALDIDGQRVNVTGYDFPWGTQEKIGPPRRDGLLNLVLSHTPDNIYRIAGSSADVVFSGHYHAGQVRLPLLGSVVIPSAYGRRFDHGHFLVNGTHLFVASGVGAVTPPVRIYCQPDIFIVDILPEETVGLRLRQSPPSSL